MNVKLVIRIIATYGLSIFLLASCVSTKKTTTALSNNELMKEDVFTKTLNHTKSSSVEYARALGPREFYMALQVAPLWGANADTSECIDKSFFSLVRKFFKEDAYSTSLISEITGPGQAKSEAVRIPLFQVGRSEQTNPPSCVSLVLDKEEIITPYYLVDPGQGFELKTDIRTNNLKNVKGVESLISASSDLLSFSGENAELIEIIASSDLLSAAKIIDDSITANWSQTNQKSVTSNIRPWPNGVMDSDWKDHTDTLTFSTSKIISSEGGLDEGRPLPTLKIYPAYLKSIFGRGEGMYIQPSQVLSKELAPSTGEKLDDILSKGIDGFNTRYIGSITENKIMQKLCSDLDITLGPLLTTNDSIYAKYSLLYQQSQYFQNRDLNSEKCLSDQDLELIKKLNPKSRVALPGARSSNQEARNKQVNERWLPLTIALRAGNKDDLEAVIEDIGAFHLIGVAGMKFENNNEATSSLSGNEAIEYLASISPIRSGCYQANPHQNLSTIPGVVLSKGADNAEIYFATFAESGKVAEITIVPLQTWSEISHLGSWPNAESCILI